MNTLSPKDDQVWLAKCLFMAAAVGIGYLTDTLQAATTSTIVLFGVNEGLLVYRRFAHAFYPDVEQSRAFMAELNSKPTSIGDEVLKLDTTNSDSACQLVVAVRTKLGRMSKAEAVVLCIDNANLQWGYMLAPLGYSADVAPMLGMLGSLIGLAGASAGLQSADSTQEIYQAFGVMAYTTIAGAGVAILLIGLHARCVRKVELFSKELELFANGLNFEPTNKTDLPEATSFD